MQIWWTIINRKQKICKKTNNNHRILKTIECCYKQFSNIKLSQSANINRPTFWYDITYSRQAAGEHINISHTCNTSLYVGWTNKFRKQAGQREGWEEERWNQKWVQLKFDWYTVCVCVGEREKNNHWLPRGDIIGT